MKKLFGDQVGAVYMNLAVLVFIAVLLAASIGVSERSVRLPVLIGSVTIAFILVDVFNILRTVRKKSAADKDSSRPVLDVKTARKIATALGFMVATVALWQLAGFIISSIIVSTGFGLYLGARNRLALVIASVALTLVLYWVFSVFLGVPLPWGLLRDLV
jgi:putative tricarboxylic transport membrane protein